MQFVLHELLNVEAEVKNMPKHFAPRCFFR
jgi:hypothetical protein